MFWNFENRKMSKCSKLKNFSFWKFWHFSIFKISKVFGIFPKIFPKCFEKYFSENFSKFWKHFFCSGFFCVTRYGYVVCKNYNFSNLQASQQRTARHTFKTSRIFPDSCTCSHPDVLLLFTQWSSVFPSKTYFCRKRWNFQNGISPWWKNIFHPTFFSGKDLCV